MIAIVDNNSGYAIAAHRYSSDEHGRRTSEHPYRVLFACVRPVHREQCS
jgi:hypothetical protein